VIATLGIEDGEFFARHYDVTPAAISKATTSSIGSSRSRAASRRSAARSAARKAPAVRGTRVRPGLDDKVLADWNGLMIAALANASLMLAEPSWLAMAARAFDFIARAMTAATGSAIPGATASSNFRASRPISPP
jgi:uncharacterized protein YyaL (SSP411 family)